MMKARFLVLGFRFSVSLCLCVSAVSILAQREQPPAPSAPKSTKVPPVLNKQLANGLTVATVEKHSTPIVTINLTFSGGAWLEPDDKAGLADMTATLLTKGTKTRTATQIAEAVEALGGTINSGATWTSASVSINVTSDKVDQALAILSDIVRNPSFSQKELDLLRSQTLDELNANLKQPGFLANYVASRAFFDEHPAGGTLASLKVITRKDVLEHYRTLFVPGYGILVFAGDITPQKAQASARKYLSAWGPRERIINIMTAPETPPDSLPQPVTKGGRLLVIDLPKSGQAAVNYGRKIDSGRAESVGDTGRHVVGKNYYSAIVLNSILGAGYSSRLNYEIRIKRGLSYGAGSSFSWRENTANFITRTQTKNQSAAEVAELVLAEIKKLTNSSVANDELVPRKSVLTGGFGRNLETTGGLASALGDLYAFGISTSELNNYVGKVNAVTDAQIKDFAAQNLLGGDIIIVGDYSIFKDDLAKRFPDMKVEVIKADELDLSKDNLRK